MTEPPRRADTRRPAAEPLVAAAVGVLILVILLQVFLSRCDSSRHDNGAGASRPTRSTSASSRLPGGSSSASRSPSPSARPDGPLGWTGAASARPAPPSGTASARPAPPSGTGSIQPVVGLTPSGAPRTGGGSGPGMRSPVLVVLGVLLLFAATALLLSRLWPPTFDSDDNGIA